MKSSDMNTLYVKALNAVEVVRECRPGCGLTSAERAAKKAAAVEPIFTFIRAKTRSRVWAERQDVMLKVMGDIV